MIQLIQIFLLVVVIYLTLSLAVRTIFGEYTSLFAVMTAMLITSMIVLTQSLP